MLRFPSRISQSVFRNISVRSASTASVPSIDNLETRWKSLSSQEQQTLTKELEELQKQDWHQLSVDQKKAAYYVAFGPHGPRKPLHGSNHGIKVSIGVIGCLLAGVGLFYYIESLVPEKPRTLTREWEEATNERLRQEKVNPISGISSEDYSGKGYVVSSK
ncbi:hypothetical protein G9A89_013031 [Geosiphon pyriformis]|nr:hypothetical protein G9A89_013031 [Geosiphon pyriformis]